MMPFLGVKCQCKADQKLDNILPLRHVAIIMDGNGRWAQARGMSRTAGHRTGVEALRKIVRHAGHRGIEFLTLFSFSSENWQRPKDEVDNLMGLMRVFVRRDLAELSKHNVRITIIGRRDNLDADVLSMLLHAEETTKSNSGLNLIIAFNYGGRDDLVRATQALAASVAEGRISPAEINEATLANALDTGKFPDPDLIIRTGGETRLSNFLMWQGAYSELIFDDRHWPDFDESAFDQAIQQYHGRDRRVGGLSRRSA